MIVVDASFLVGELLRKRGRELLLRTDLRVLVAEHEWEETPGQTPPVQNGDDCVIATRWYADTCGEERFRRCCT